MVGEAILFHGSSDSLIPFFASFLNAHLSQELLLSVAHPACFRGMAFHASSMTMHLRFFFRRIFCKEHVHDDLAMLPSLAFLIG